MIKAEMGVLKMTTGEKLQKLRKSNNITQEQLSEILNVSRQSISKWEGDLAFPETDKLIALAKIYNCSVDYLLNIENNQNSLTNDKQTIEKKAYNTSKLPFLIACSFMIILSFVLFALDWVSVFDAESSKYIDFSFYKIVFATSGSRNYLAIVGAFLFVNNFVILGLCIAYFIVDKLILSIFLRIFSIIQMLLIFIFKDWATLTIIAVTLGGCHVALAMQLVLTLLSFILLFATKEFKSIKTTSVMRKNIFAFSTIGVSILFFLTSAIPVFYYPGSGPVYISGEVYYKAGFFTSLFSFLMSNSYTPLVIYFSIVCVVVLSSFVLGLVYCFKPNKPLKTVNLVLNCIATVLFLFTTIFYTPAHGETLCKTFIIMMSLLQITLIVVQARIMHLDKKELKEKQ